MQPVDYQSLTPPRERRAKIVVFCTALLFIFTACQPANIICGVPAQGTIFNLMEELTYNPNATAHPFDYLICQRKAYIYCEDLQGNTITIICDLDEQHNITNIY